MKELFRMTTNWHNPLCDETRKIELAADTKNFLMLDPESGRAIVDVESEQLILSEYWDWSQ